MQQCDISIPQIQVSLFEGLINCLLIMRSGVFFERRKLRNLSPRRHLAARLLCDFQNTRKPSIFKCLAAVRILTNKLLR